MVHKALDKTISEMGLFSLKEEQTEDVFSIVAGKDTLVTLPTGYGKSTIYGVLPLLFDKLRHEIAYNGY